MSTITQPTATRGGGTPYMQALGRPPRRARYAADPDAEAASLRRRLIVGGRIRQARRRVGLSQEQLTLRIDTFSREQLSAWENGKYSPSPLHLDQLAEELDRPVHYFFGGPTSDPFPAGQDPDPYAVPTPDPADALAEIGKLLAVLDRVSGRLRALGFGAIR